MFLPKNSKFRFKKKKKKLTFSLFAPNRPSYQTVSFTDTLVPGLALTLVHIQGITDFQRTSEPLR